MEPTIYNPSIYKGAGIYNIGGGGFGVGVDIGGFVYPITRIGNKYWLAQNLDYYDNDFIKNAPSISGVIPQVNYYDNDEITNGKNGLKLGALYNYKAVELLIEKNIFPTGWRVPKKNDFDDILDLIDISGLLNNQQLLFENPQPAYSLLTPKKNSFGFCAIPSGLFNDNYLFKTDYLFLWSSTDYDTQKKYLFVCDDNVTPEQPRPYYSNAFTDRQYSLRLCCDVV